MHVFMIVLNYISVFVVLGCVVLVATHKESKMQKLILLECLSLFICCLGFLLRIQATELELLDASQKIIYASVTHAMLLMLLFIVEYCNFKVPKWLPWIFHAINLAITITVLLDNFNDQIPLLYASTSLDGGEYVKEYGPLHTIAIIVFGLYMVASVVIAIFYTIKNARKRSKNVWLMLVAVAVPCLSYIISKVLGDDTDIQPVGFAVFAILIIVMVYSENLYDVKNIAADYSIKSLKDAFIVFDNNYRFKGCNEIAAKYFPILTEITINSDIRNESEIITNIYESKLTEYYFEDKILNVSIRPIDNNGKEVGKVIWMNDVTVERNYTKLLENEVVALSDISYKDQLTGLENRRSYEKQLDTIRDSEDGITITIFTFDINGLKITNDTYGHAVGDELIKESAKIIKETFALAGMVYRLGGDEFSAVIVGPAEIENLKESFEKNVNNYSGKYKPKISISYGCASDVTSSKFSIEELINEADMDMYRTKEKYYIESKAKRTR